MTEENLEESAKRKGLRGTFGSARDAIGSSLDKVSGTEYRRQLEEFTNVVQTTIVGIHRDQQELDKRLADLERSTAAARAIAPSPKRIVVALIFSVTAVVLAVSAVVLVVKF